jgi:hypothetical protein
VTASDAFRDANDSGPSLAERALDVFVYLPAGALLTALEDMPETVAKGRSRIDQELRNAKIVGRFAVDVGLRQLKEQAEWFAGRRDPTESGGPAAVRPPPAAPRPSAPPRDPQVDRAIPDYDILAASQVVRRLDGLGHDELRAVVRYERATRGRRTILKRAEQLLSEGGRQDPRGGDGRSGPPGPADA